MSWRRTSTPGIGASPPPYRPLVRPVTDASFKYTLFRTRSRTYYSGFGGWQAWGAWSAFDSYFPACWFIGGTAINDTSGPTETRVEYEMEVAAHGSPWAIAWINVITPLGGGSTSEDENYLLILPGATYTANFTAASDTSVALDNWQLHEPAS
jgi:hypothetical protein